MTISSYQTQTQHVEVLAHQNVKNSYLWYNSSCLSSRKNKEKIQTKKSQQKQARISTDGSRFKEENKKGTKWLKDNGFLDENFPVEKADVGENTDLKKTSGASIAAKNIVKNIVTCLEKNLMENDLKG